MKRRIGSLLLALAMCLSLLPTAAFAEQVEPAEQPLPQEQVAPTPEQPEELEQPEEPEEPEQPEENEPVEQPVQPEPALQALENTSAPLAADVDVATHTGDHTGWAEISTADGLTSATEGYYYLTDTITLSTTWEPANGVVLCLNGYSITMRGNGDVIKVGTGHGFTLTDCKRGDTVDYGKITHETGCTGRGVYVSGGTFHMYGGSITGNDATSSNGGGVRVDGSGRFEMSGGTITGNVTTSSGGGVYVGGSGSKFEMSGSASITGNTASGSNNGGGGVYVESGSKFEMSGGSITGNTASGFNSSHGGGGVYVGGGTFTMSGGTIGGTGDAANKATYGGGVYVGGGTFEMSGSASITGNTADDNGGGVYVGSGSKFKMSGSAAQISGNKAASSGGGVYVGGGTFEMSGSAAQISGNKADQGGGVYVNPDGTFEMSGSAAQISDNTATYYGGGVYAAGKFTMSGGTIGGTGNDANTATLSGGGVFVNTTGFTVSGSVRITGNYKGSTGSAADNVYLYSSNYPIKIGKAGLYDGAIIGVTPSDTPTADKPVQIATGAQEGVDYTKIFQQDATDTTYEIYAKDDGVYLSTHRHKWTYTVQASDDGKSVTATAVCDPCPEPLPASSNSRTESFIYYVPDSLTYDGSKKEIKHQSGETAAGTVNPFAGKVNISYERQKGTDWEALSDNAKPIDAGTYRATVAVDGKSASVTYEITKATPKASDFTFNAPSDLTYNGSAKVATVTAKNPGMGEVKVKYFKNNVETEPKDAGTYTVKISVAEGTNYNAATADLMDNSWSFTITQADQTINVPANATITNNDKPVDISDWASVTGVPGDTRLGRLSYELYGTPPAGVKLVDGKLTVPAGVTAGTKITIKVNATKMLNYKAAENTFDVTVVAKKTAAVSTEDDCPTMAYGDIITVKATAKDADGHELTGGKWRWDYNNTYFKLEESNENTGVIKLQAIQAHSGTINVATATYESDDYVGSSTLEKGNIARKTLTQSDLTGIPTSLTKTYDGGTGYTYPNGTAIALTLKESAQVLDSDRYTQIGINANQITFAQSDAGTTTATITLNALPDQWNYKFANGFTEISGIPATITPRPLTIASATAAGRTFVPDNKSVDVDVTFDNLPSNVTLTKGEDYTATGTMDNHDAGTKTVAVTVTLKNDNYTLNQNTTTTTVDISKATYAGGSKEIPHRYNEAGEKTVSLNLSLPYGLGSSLYSIQNYTDNGVLTGTPTMANGEYNSTVAYTLAGQNQYTANQTAQFTVKVESPNYEDFTVTYTITLTDKSPANVTISGLPENGVTFGDKITLTASQTGDTTNTGTWTWTYDHTYFRAVGDTNTAAITLQAIKPSTDPLSITAQYDSTDYRGSQSVTVTSIDKKALHLEDLNIPRAHKVYDGTPFATYKDASPFLISAKSTSMINGKGFVLPLTNDDIIFATFDAGKTTASVKIPSFDNDYYVLGDDLAGQTITVEAVITPCPLEIKSAAAVDRVYKPGDTSVEIRTVTFYQQLAKSPVMGTDYTVTGTMADANVGDGKQVTVTLTVLSKNFEKFEPSGPCTTTVNITPAPAPTLPDINLSHKHTLTGPQTAQLPALTDGAAYVLGAATGDTAILSTYSVQNDVLTYTLSGTGAAGDSVTLPVTLRSGNYVTDPTFDVVITLTAKDVPAVTANDITLTYTGSAIPASAITGTADVEGAWSWKSTAPQNVADSGAHTVVFTPADTANYAPAEVNITVTITPAAATGAPKYTKITSGGKTLADAALTADGSTLSPAAGTLEWLDDAGSVLPDTTAVEANKTYTWRFTPAGGNHTVLTGTVELYHVTSGSGRRTTPTVDVSKLPLLRTGSTGEYVKWLQQRLNALGYDCGSADGIFGSRTYTAVTAFQKANGLSVDGIVGHLTWTRLDMGAILPANTTLDAALPLLRTGSTGEYVKRLQKRLNALGYDCGDADGIFGSRTHAAVIAFQKANGLSADGIAGPLTWAKLG